MFHRHRLKQLLDDYEGELVFPHCDGGLMRVTTIIRVGIKKVAASDRCKCRSDQ